MKILRWIIIIVAILFLCAPLQFSLPKLVPVILPVIQVAPEFPFGGNIISNSLIMMFVVDILVLAFFFFGTRNLQMVPRGFQNTLETLVEVVYGLVQTVAGSKARRLFPLVGTIFFLVLFANYMELVPLVDSVGAIWPAEAGRQGYEVKYLLNVIPYLDAHCPVLSDAQASKLTAQQKADRAAAGCTSQPYKAAAAGKTGLASTQPVAQEEATHGFVVRPFLRTLSTDLNFTLALALVVVFMTQVYGVRALGAGNYFSRFFNLRGFARSKIFGPLDFAVSILELISEISRIISFTFRLFGNIFAGTVLIFVISWLIPYIMPLIPYLLEVFVGLIQAFVFMMLATVFITMAQIGHGEEHEEHGEAAAH